MKSDMSAGPNLQSKAQLFHGTFPVNNMILKRIRAINIIRPNTPLYGGGDRGVPSPSRKHANVFRSAFWEG